MDLGKTIRTVHSALKGQGIAHALIGGFALSVHNVARATEDVDLLADGVRRQDIIQALSAAGFVLRFESKEVLQFEGVGLLDILLANRPLSQAMLTTAPADNDLNIPCVTAEDIIGLKIQAYKNDPQRRLRDQADIQAIRDAL